MLDLDGIYKARIRRDEATDPGLRCNYSPEGLDSAWPPKPLRIALSTFSA